MSCLRFHARLLLLIALLLLPLAGAIADDGMDRSRPRFLDMSGARVLASPGVPPALEAFLPGGRRPARLVWPLPATSLLILGLPASDPVARRICDVYQLDVDDLGGGYKIWAWRAGARSFVFLMGADAAALQAARFEFDASAPREMMDPNMRSLDFRQPNQEAAVIVASGTRQVTPRFSLRAWFPDDPARAGDPITAAGANANRAWIDAHTPVDGAALRRIEALRAQGVVPVLVAGPFARSDAASPIEAAAGLFTGWQQRAGIRHFALRFDRLEPAPTRDARPAWAEAAIVRGVLERLRPGGLDTLVVVPRAHSDRLARTLGAPPDLRAFPEVAVAWSGPSEHSLHVTRAQAGRRVREAGVPVFLLETWSAGATSAAAIPTLPRGRADDLGGVLAGVIVVGRQGAEATLEGAWQPAGEPRFGMAELAPLLPTGEQRPGPFLETLATQLERAAKESLGLVPWMAPLGSELRTDATRVAAAGGVLMLSASDVARVLPGAGPAVVTLRCDGEALVVQVRVLGQADGGPLRWRFHLQLEAPGRTARWRVTVGPLAHDIHAVFTPGLLHLEHGHVTCMETTDAGGTVVEMVFDRFALGGEPHAGRVFDCTLTWTAAAAKARRWPAGTKAGAIVITR